MKRLKNRKTAILITVVAAILATLFGVHRSLTLLSDDVETMFYDGMYLEREGYRQASIDSQLRKELESATGIVTIARNYDELAEEAENLNKARLELLNAGSIQDKGYANLKMTYAFDALRYAYPDVDLTELDREALNHYVATFQGAHKVIESSRYNDEVTKFLQGESYSGLAALLRPFVFVKPPQMFINNQS